jgi:hypothetical protein
MAFTFPLVIALCALAVHGVATLVIVRRLAASRLPNAALYIAALMVVGMLNDTLSLVGGLLKFVTYGYFRAHLYTVIELWLFAMFSFSAVAGKIARRSIICLAVVLTVVNATFHWYGLDTWKMFDSYSSGVSALAIIAFCYIVLWQNSRDIVRREEKRWLGILCITLIGTSLVDFLIFFYVNLAQVEEKNIWFIHNLASIVKYSITIYCFWKKL